MQKRSQSFNSFSKAVGKKGTLKKKGFWSSWNDAWFILQGETLLEFKSQHSSRVSKVYYLRKYTLKLGENITGLTQSFALFRPNKDPVFFVAPNDAEMVEWVTALKEYCKDAILDWGTDPILEAFHDPVLVCSESGIIIGSNAATESTFGYKKGQLMGSHMSLLMPFFSRGQSFLQKCLQIGKLTNRPVVMADRKTQVEVTLSLGEFEDSGAKKFIVSIRPEHSQERDNAKAIETIIDRILGQVSTDLKSNLSKEFQTLYSVIGSGKEAAYIPSNLHCTISLPEKKKPLTFDFLQVDTSDIIINETLSDVIGGNGAMVYACTVDGWQCAMKEFNVEGLQKETVDGIETEVKILESLPVHPNLVRYLFHQRTENKIRIFMTRYATNLATFIKSRKKDLNYFQLSEIVRYTLDIVKGLEVLHDLNIIHRDLKSDNIFVCLNPSGIENLAIADFDTAKCVIEGVARTTIGTPGYMAPEVVRSKNRIEYTFSVDIWAIGMLILEMMTLKRPFEDHNMLEVSSIIEQGVIPTLDPDIESKYSPLLPLWRSCLSFNPENRPTARKCKEILAGLM